MLLFLHDRFERFQLFVNVHHFAPIPESVISSPKKLNSLSCPSFLDTMSTLTSNPGKSPFAGSGDRNGLMTYTSMDSSNGGGGGSRNGSGGRNGSAVAGGGAAVAMGDYREDRHDLLLSPRSSKQSEYNPNVTFKRPTGMLY